jgi:hypothetical protein
VVAAASRVLNRAPGAVRSHWAGKGDALAAVQRSQWTGGLATHGCGIVRSLLGWPALAQRPRAGRPPHERRRGALARRRRRRLEIDRGVLRRSVTTTSPPHGAWAMPARPRAQSSRS